MKKENKVLLIVALFYLIYILVYLSRFEFNPSATIELSEASLKYYNGVLPKNLIVHTSDVGYDGHFFYMMATDLLHNRILIPAYRHQRILYPLLAYVLAFGNINLFPSTLILINYLSVILGTYILLLILKKYKANLYLGFLWAFNVGFFICIARDLCAPLLFLFILLAAYNLEKKCFYLSSLFLLFAILTKESAVIIILPLLVYFVLRKDFKKIFIYCLPLAALSIWQMLLFIKFGDIPLFENLERVSFPFIGITKYLINIDFSQDLKQLCHYLFALSPSLFAIIVSYILFTEKEKRLTIYSTILMFQILFIFSLSFKMHIDKIDATGRYAIGLFLFYILYISERKQKYNSLLIFLTFLMSVGYFIAKIIRFKIEYLVT